MKKVICICLLFGKILLSAYTEEQKREVQKKINNMADIMNKALKNNSDMKSTLGRIKPPNYK